MEESRNMTKKIFALVLTACVLGVMIGGCSKPADDSTAGTAGGTATTTGGTATTTGK